MPALRSRAHTRTAAHRIWWSYVSYNRAPGTGWPVTCWWVQGCCTCLAPASDHRYRCWLWDCSPLISLLFFHWTRWHSQASCWMNLTHWHSACRSPQGGGSRTPWTLCCRSAGTCPCPGWWSCRWCWGTRFCMRSWARSPCCSCTPPRSRVRHACAGCVGCWCKSSPDPPCAARTLGSVSIAPIVVIRIISGFGSSWRAGWAQPMTV